MKKLAAVLLFVFLVLPVSAQAQGDGLVSCSGVDCNFCDVITTTDNVVGFLFSTLTFIAVLLLVYAGFRLTTSAGNVTVATEARNMFTSVIIGLVIVLSAWLLVDTVLKLLLGGAFSQDGGTANTEFGFWNELRGDCGGLGNEATSVDVPSTDYSGPPDLDAQNSGFNLINSDPANDN